MKLRKEVGRLSVSVWHNSLFFILFLEAGLGARAHEASSANKRRWGMSGAPT